MLLEIWQIVLGIIGSGLSAAVLALIGIWIVPKYQKRKGVAEAGRTEVELAKAEIEIESLKDAENRRQMQELLDELQEHRAKTAAWLKEKEALLEAQSLLEIKVISLTRRMLIAEEKYKNSRCDCFTCAQRIPPFEDADNL